MLLEETGKKPIEVWPKLKTDKRAWSIYRFSPYLRDGRNWPSKWYRPLRIALGMEEVLFYDYVRRWYK